MITILHTLSLASNQTSVSRVLGSILPITQIKENRLIGGENASEARRGWRECPDRLVGDVGVAEGERAEASKARRGERNDAEAEPAERHPLQRVPGLEQVAGELQLQERRQVQDVHLDLPGAPPHGGRDPPDDVPPERAVARPCCP